MRTGTLAGSWEIAQASILEQSPGRRLKRCRKMVQNNIVTALGTARRELLGRKGVVCVTGSFYAVAEASKALEQDTTADYHD